MLLQTSEKLLLIIDFTTCSIYVAHTTELFMNCISFPFHFRPHFSYLIIHTPTPEERHTLFQPVTPSSSSALSYAKVAPYNYPPVFSTWLPLKYFCSLTLPHYPNISRSPQPVCCCLPETEEYKVGQEVEGAWHPQLETLCIQKSFKSTQLPSASLSFSCSSSLSCFILTLHLEFSPHHLGNLSNV